MKLDALSWEQVEEKIAPVLEKMSNALLLPSEQEDAAELIGEAIKRLENTVRAHGASIRALSETLMAKTKNENRD